MSTHCVVRNLYTLVFGIYTYINIYIYENSDMSVSKHITMNQCDDPIWVWVCIKSIIHKRKQIMGLKEKMK